jgi:hypothetical protein
LSYPGAAHSRQGAKQYYEISLALLVILVFRCGGAGRFTAAANGRPSALNNVRVLAVPAHTGAAAHPFASTTIV